MIKNNANKTIMTFLMVAAIATIITTMSIAPALAHNPPYRDSYWFDHDGDPEVCYLESELDDMTVDGSTGNGADVETAVELTRAEYNSEINGLTIAAEDSTCSYNYIEVGAKDIGLFANGVAQTVAYHPTPNLYDYAEVEVDFNDTWVDYEIGSDACDIWNDKDPEWIANHEFGHALSLGHHSGSGTVMDAGCHNDYASVDSESENALESRY